MNQTKRSWTPRTPDVLSLTPGIATDDNLMFVGYDGTGAHVWERIEFAPGNTLLEATAQAAGSSQAFFWTAEWQRNERIADAELANGQGRRFATADEAISWLNTPEPIAEQGRR